MKLPFLRRSPRRTTLLGVTLLAVMLWTGVSQLGLNVNELLAQLVLLLVVLLAIVVLAGICALPLMLLRRRRMLQRREGVPQADQATVSPLPEEQAGRGEP